MERVNQYQRLRAGSNITDGDDYKNTLSAVTKIAAEYLSKTLGPYAHTTVIDDGSFRYSTKDGWSIASRLNFNDALANSLYAFIRGISFSLVSKVGDGTTTAIVAANEFIEQWMNPNITAVFSQFRQKDILEALDTVKLQAIENLQSEIHVIDPNGDFSDIFKIAYTSSNGDGDLAKMIQQIYQETGNPNIYVELGDARQTNYKIQKGYKLDCAPKMLSAWANTDAGEFKTMHGDVIGFFFNHNVTYTLHRKIINAIFQYVGRVSGERGHRVLAAIFAPYFDDTMAATIRNSDQVDISNNRMPMLMMVQTPMSNTNQQNFFDDACVINQVQIMDAAVVEGLNRLLDPESFTEESQEAFKENLQTIMTVDGHTPTPQEFLKTYAADIDEATFSKDFVLFEKYDTENDRYQKRLKEITEANQKAQDAAAMRTNALDRESMDANMRYVRFFGQMGLISVGGESDLERKCRKDSVDDAVLACRSAFECGYVRGMNLATLASLRKMLPHDVEPYHLPEDKQLTLDQVLIILLYKSFVGVVTHIFRNAYPEINDPTVGEILIHDPYVKSEEDPAGAHYRATIADFVQYAVANDRGFDAVSMGFENSDALTIVNSVDTDVEILKAIVSILGYVMTSDQMLSMAKGYDKETARQIVLADDYEKYTNIAQAVIDTAKK